MIHILDRSELNERREKLFDLLHKLYFIANVDSTPPDESIRIMKLIGEYAEDDAEYTGMVRAGMKSGFAMIESVSKRSPGNLVTRLRLVTHGKRLCLRTD